VPGRRRRGAFALAPGRRPRYRRRHSLTFPTLVPYGWSDRWAALFTAAAEHRAAAGDGPVTPGRLLPGRVVRHDGVALSLALPDGIRSVTLSRQLEPAPTVGDWVVVDGEVPVEVLPRSSVLIRRSVRTEAPQQLAANVDGVLIVCGFDRPLRDGRIDRVITLAWEAGAVPAVVLTKSDLAPDSAQQAVALAAAHPGVDVVTTSAVAGTGIDELRALADGRTVVLVGESGAGKSTLVNALIGDEVMATGVVRSGDAKGRHTTTTREAHPLPGGGVLIDTPGLRSVGLWADREAVAAAFSDIDELASGCRFNDCSHGSEPGCAVRAALADGTLTAERFAGWEALEREAAAAELRASPHLQRAQGRRFSRVTKDAQRRKGRTDE
jgi:ribosome biogenesis GTPase